MAYFGVTPYRKVGDPGTDFQTFHSQIKVTLNVTFSKCKKERGKFLVNFVR